ncbi:hypothetical protein ABB37_03001 [Leptomonas pyrrhocoris]|uniref:Arf3-interacting protein 1 N-terminal domain-containing protein n=1 Tax=Leptomonas pyrrhocoris TaxID=157538 RepID=A0A0M9G6L6_LEPPY|nr:hypothetical protein ABB37_03001 [Leptomonas pyrrhocoris]KPA83349.1 hypothetical protein ABB37_03001 [Leptomonas pyrrhocoris]|eukprot:XP_015661788.1 hypothetical protein ABB37_03001 [Leptomonas pyrrhocoris]
MPPVSSTNAAPLLATSLIIAEFDIDTGASLRACYPRAAPAASSSPTSPHPPTADSVEAAVPPGIAGHTEYFANVMLPDGAEKVSVTRTVFVVNRPQPAVFLRFPVYRFVRASAEAAGQRSPHSPPLPPVSGGADAACHWCRAPGEETALYVPEMLLINTSTRAVSLRYKDTEIEAAMVLPIENISSLPSLPADVVRFSKQLEAMLMNEGMLAGSRTASFAAGGGDSVIGDGGGAGNFAAVPAASASLSLSPGGGNSSRHNSSTSDYAFVVIAYTDSRHEGYLMRVSQFERLLREMMAMLEGAGKSASAEAATTAPPPPPQSGANAAHAAHRGGSGVPGGALNPDPQAERGGNPATVSDALHSPPAESVGDSVRTPVTSLSRVDSNSGDSDNRGGMWLPASVTPPSPGARFDADASTPPTVPVAAAVNRLTPPTSEENTVHLLLPRADSVHSNGSDVTAASGVLQGARRFADSSAAPLGQATMGSGKSTDGESGTAAASGPVLFGLCAVVSKRDSTARRGGITKSVAVLGPSLVWLEPFFPVLVAAAQYCCDVSGTNEEALRELQRILKRCYDSINNAAGVVAAGRAKVDQLTAEIGKYCAIGSGQQAYVYYNDAPFGTTIKAKIPLSPESSDIAFTKYSIETLIEVLGPSSLQLILGILTEKKILILSRKGEATDVCEVALSLGIIGTLLDSSFIAKKVFPYVSVSSVDHFQHVPGYVVGTLNPIFENASPWGWDLLCDLDNKTVMTAAERTLRRQIGSSTSAAGNWATATAGLANAVGVGGGGAEAEALRSLPPPLQRLYKKLVNSVYHLRALRVSAAERNRRLRLVLEDFLYTMVMVGYVTGGNIAVPTSLYPVFAHRSLGVLRQEMMLTAMLDNVSTQVLHPKESPALLLNCAALRHCASGETPVQRTLTALLHLLESPYDVKLFLRRMALAVGGLNAVGMQLTHPSSDTRAAAAALLARVESVAEGKAAVASMNNFFLMIYENGVKGASQ